LSYLKQKNGIWIDTLPVTAWFTKIKNIFNKFSKFPHNFHSSQAFFANFVVLTAITTLVFATLGNFL